MNIKLKNCLRDASNYVGICFTQFLQTLVSLLRMLVLSSIKTAIRSGKYDKFIKSDVCVVLGNGPSLKEAIEKNEVDIADKDVFCVNNFCDSEYFWSIKPRFYVMIDGAFF